MPDAPFVFTAIENDSLQHRYVGFAPGSKFEFTNLFLDRGSWMSLLGGVGLEEQIGRGHMWVSIVDADKEPITGATATLDVASDPAFVLLNTNVPWTQNSISEGGKATLFFANIEPQEATVTITTPDDLTCSQFVFGPTGFTASTTIYANTASILRFTCY
jgi:hypothetical protein